MIIYVLLASVLNGAHAVCLKTVQKNCINNKMDNLVFNFTLCIIQVTLFMALPPYRRLVFNLTTVMLSLAFAALALIVYIFLLKSMSEGPLSLTSLLMNCNISIPIIFSILFWREAITWKAILGLFLMAGGLMFVSGSSYSEKNEQKRIQKKWLLFICISFIASGFAMTFSKLHAIARPDHAKEYLVLYNLFIVFGISIYFAFKREGMKALITNKNFVLYSFYAAMTSVAANIIFMSVVAKVDFIVFFPLIKIGNITFVLLFSCLALKEGLGKRAMLGMLISLFAIVILS